jgi:flagellar motor switch protein FliG
MSPGVSYAPVDVSKMSKLQKLAILLIVLGADSAAQILKHLDEHELEAVSAEMSKQSLVSHETQIEVLKEFSEVALEASTSVRGGIDYAQTTLEKAFGTSRASDVINRLSPRRAPAGPLQKLIDADSKQLFNLIRQEMPQTVALIISHLPSEKASQLLEMMPSEQRDKVVERVATLSPTPIEAVERVLDVLVSKLSANPARAFTRTGGVKSAAELLNALDRNTSRTILSAIEGRNADLGASIRKDMLSFEDLVGIHVTDLDKVIREIDLRDLAVALMTASRQLKTKLLGAISKGAAEAVLEEMSFAGAIRFREINAAQTRILDVVRRLEAEGELEIHRKKENTDSVALAT